MQNRTHSVRPELFPGAQVTPTPIHDFYEVVTNRDVFYSTGNGEFLFFGDLVGPDGRSLTAPTRNKPIAENAVKLPLSEAIKIGSGTVNIIEFTDPSDHNSRMLHAYLTGAREQITRYVFMSPERGSYGEYLAARIIERPEIFDRAYAGHLDDLIPERPSQETSQKIDRHLAAFRLLHIKGVPSLIAGKTCLLGCDIQAIDKAIARARAEALQAEDLTATEP